MRWSACVGLLVGAGLFLVCSATRPAAAAILLGTTAADPTGAVGVALVDQATGQATPWFDVSISPGFAAGQLAHHGPSGDLLLLLVGNGAVPENRLARINLSTQSIVEQVITGLPEGFNQVSGLEYDAASDQIVITFGQSGSNAEDRLAEIDLAGVVVQSTGALGAGDRDVVGFDAAGLQLLLMDFNTASPERVQRIDDPFSSPVLTPLGSLPQADDLGDVAVAPDTGVVYVTRFTPAGGELVALDALSTYTTVGSYGIGEQIVGLAFVPEPASLGLAALAGLLLCGHLLGARRRS